MSTQKTESLLGTYRVLDLTDEKGLLCGKLYGWGGRCAEAVKRNSQDLSLLRAILH